MLFRGGGRSLDSIGLCLLERVAEVVAHGVHECYVVSRCIVKRNDLTLPVTRVMPLYLKSRQRVWEKWRRERWEDGGENPTKRIWEHRQSDLQYDSSTVKLCAVRMRLCSRAHCEVVQVVDARKLH